VAWLAEADLVRFATDGYLLVPGVVPEELLAAADREIDEVTAQEGDAGQAGWFLSRQRLPCCEDVLRLSPAASIAGELVAPNTLDFAFDHIQIATTDPGESRVPDGPHIDGHRPGQDAPLSFTLLAGVLLTDQRESQSGNLWVWPGSHLDHQRLFHERGPDVLLESSGHSTTLNPPLDLCPPVELHGDRGDLLLAHFLLGHNGGGNTADHVRRTLYYRLAVPGHPDRWEQTFLDVWTEYPPVRRAATFTSSS
jgi:ectoine hydroxylase-related dioxygenase (phytanoyl-CoA dioxygenase family)